MQDDLIRCQKNIPRNIPYTIPSTISYNTKNTMQHVIPHMYWYHTIPYQKTQHYTIPQTYHTIPFHPITHHTKPHHASTIPYHTIPYHTIPTILHITLSYDTILYYNAPHHITLQYYITPHQRNKILTTFPLREQSIFSRFSTKCNDARSFV